MNNLNNIQNDSKTLTNNVVKAESWLKTHERLVIITLLLIVAFFFLDKSLGIVADYEQHRANEAAQTLAIDKAKADSELAQAKQMLSDYEATISQNEKLNATLEAGIQSRDALLAAQQRKDVVLPPSELSHRWQTLVGDSGIQPNTSGFTVSDTAARATVSKLEQVPVLEQNLVDEKQKSANLQVNVDKANDLISQGKVAVNGLQLQLQDQDKSCKAEVSALKAKGRKNVLKAFGIGFITGFVAGHIW